MIALRDYQHRPHTRGSAGRPVHARALGMLLGTALCLGGGLLGAGPSAAAEPAATTLPRVGTPDWDRNQERVDALAERIRRASGPSSLAGLRVDPARLEVVVRWKGQVPSDLRSLAANGRDGVSVRVGSAAHTREELLRAAEALMARSGADRPSAVALASDGSALEVEMPVALTPAARTAVARGVQVPVRVHQSQQVVPVTRQNDSSPWIGGGAMTSSAFCSTGFAVVRPDGYGRLLSAGHCDPSGNWAWKDGAGDSLTVGGSAVAVNLSRDSMLIDPVGGTEGKVHGGPYNASSSDSRYHLRVAGSSNNNNGDSVCTSGANSGEHCVLIITNDAVLWNCNGYTCSGSRAEPGTNSAAAIGGDSGGPVYANRSDGRVTARGIISAVDTPAPCPSYRTFPGYFSGTTIPKCGKRVYYYPIQPLLSAWRVSLETS